MSGSNARGAGFLVFISASMIGWITLSDFMIIGILVCVRLWLLSKQIDISRMHDVHHRHDFFAMNPPVLVPMITPEDQK